MDSVKFLLQGGVHEAQIRGLFGGSATFDGAAPVFDHPLYLLGFSNRSGSNLLAEYLRSTSCFSGFNEQLNHETVREQARKLSVQSFPDFIRADTAKYGKAGRMHGYKASWDQILMLYRLRIPSMYRGGARIIHITRDDLIGQGISYHIASQTKRWSSLHKGEPTEPDYDHGKISALVGAAQLSAAAIQNLAVIFEIPRFHLTYEALVERPRRTVQRIGTFAGVNLADWVPPKTRLQRQSDALNDAYRARYLAHSQAMLLG